MARDCELTKPPAAWWLTSAAGPRKSRNPLGDIVTSCSVRTAGDDFDEAIISYIKKKYNLLIGSAPPKTLKSIRLRLPCGEEMEMEVKDATSSTGCPKTSPYRHPKLRGARGPVNAIVNAIRYTLENTPPELAADIIDNGIMLTGGGALLRALDQIISRETGIPVHIAENPMDCVVIGTGKCLDLGMVSDFRTRRTR